MFTSSDTLKCTKTLRKRGRTVLQITQVALRTAFDTDTAQNKLPVREKKSPNYDTLGSPHPHSNFMMYSVIKSF